MGSEDFKSIGTGRQLWKVAGAKRTSCKRGALGVKGYLFLFYSLMVKG